MEDRLNPKPAMSDQFHTYYQSPIGLIRISGTEHFISEVSLPLPSFPEPFQIAVAVRFMSLLIYKFE